jgi:hypothetical protein
MYVFEFLKKIKKNLNLNFFIFIFVISN